jgi:GNAT superfamily N-acetyltransferase
MKQDGLRIETIRARDLHTFFLNYAQKSENQEISPISQYRAESQSQNPYADEDDPGLLAAYIGDRCVGYQGIIPGLLRTQGGLSKVYWCTAAYVLPEFRKRMVAIQLIRKLTSLKKDIVLTGFDGVVADVFKGFHFQEIGPLNYFTVRPDRLDPFSYPFRHFYRLQKKWPGLRKLSESAIAMTRRVSYPGVRRAFYSFVARRAEKALRNVRWHELRRVEGFDRVPCADTGKPRFERGSEAINWMLAHPWIREGAAPMQPPYYFSEAYEGFRYAVLAIAGHDQCGGSFVTLSLLRDRGESKLKVLDLQCGKQDLDDIFWLIWKYAAKHQADEIEMPAAFESQLALLPLGSGAMKREQRRYLCHPFSQNSPLAAALPELALSLCDGDCAFT